MPISFQQSVQAIKEAPVDKDAAIVGTRFPQIVTIRRARRAFYRVAVITFAFLLWDCAAASSSPGTVQLKANWNLASANQAGTSGEKISQPGYAMKGWYPVRQVPATVLEILQEDGVYPNLYYGENLLKKVPQDLYKQDWWYRTTLQGSRAGQDLLAGFSRHQLPGRDLAERQADRGQSADCRHVCGRRS